MNDDNNDNDDATNIESQPQLNPLTNIHASPKSTISRDDHNMLMDQLMMLDAILSNNNSSSNSHNPNSCNSSFSVLPDFGSVDDLSSYDGSSSQSLLDHLSNNNNNNSNSNNNDRNCVGNAAGRQQQEQQQGATPGTDFATLRKADEVSYNNNNVNGLWDLEGDGGDSRVVAGGGKKGAYFKGKSKSITQNLHPEGLSLHFTNHPADSSSTGDNSVVRDPIMSAGAAAAAASSSSAAVKEDQPPLVVQFANLAKRLGVELTPSVLESLQQQEVADRTNGKYVHASKGASKNGASASTTESVSVSSTKKIKLEIVQPPVAFKPKVQVIRDVAQETVSAMTIGSSNIAESGKVAYSVQPTNFSNKSGVNASSSVGPPPSNPANIHALGLSSRGGKKRKRVLTATDLSEKLNALKQENEMLRRQVDIVTNKTARFDKDRALAEQKMRTMIDNDNCSSDELDKLVMNHLEMYADYGSSRHEELAFHLNQLEK